METPVNKVATKCLSVLLMLALVSTSWAQVPSASACKPTGTLFGFFNGVQTTSDQAKKALDKLKKIHGETNAAGEKISYEVFYNYSNGFEDFVETFDQRLKEQDGLLQGRFELFFGAVHGGGDWWSDLTGAVAGFGDLLDALIDLVKASAISGLTALIANPPTSTNYAEHRLRIDNNALEGKKMLFVAHSQGNLFVNAAYQYAVTKLPVASVKVVHIAPASPTLSGAHILANLDLVINGLRLVGTVPSITHNIPGILLRPANPATNTKDPLGHGLIEIYINPLLDISIAVKTAINTALNALETPPAKATGGFFTATLTWNGPGDVDLHVTEPGGSRVYFENKTGQAGYLDVDNTVANGPEHYYASCDTSKLQEGTYTIALANYKGADGRAATVQIATTQGVLGTLSETLGGPTGTAPNPPIFKVKVRKNTQTNQFEASL